MATGWKDQTGREFQPPQVRFIQIKTRSESASRSEEAVILESQSSASFWSWAIHKNDDYQDQSQQGSQSQTEGNRSRRSEVRPYPPPGINNVQNLTVNRHSSQRGSNEDMILNTAISSKADEWTKEFNKIFSEMRSTNKLEKSRQSARECRARKKLRYQVRLDHQRDRNNLDDHHKHRDRDRHHHYDHHSHKAQIPGPIAGSS